MNPPPAPTLFWDLFVRNTHRGATRVQRFEISAISLFRDAASSRQRHSRGGTERIPPPILSSPAPRSPRGPRIAPNPTRVNDAKNLPRERPINQTLGSSGPLRVFAPPPLIPPGTGAPPKPRGQPKGRAERRKGLSWETEQQDRIRHRPHRPKEVGGNAKGAAPPAAPSHRPPDRGRAGAARPGPAAGGKPLHPSAVSGLGGSRNDCFGSATKIHIRRTICKSRPKRDGTRRQSSP